MTEYSSHNEEQTINDNDLAIIVSNLPKSPPKQPSPKAEFHKPVLFSIEEQMQLEKSLNYLAQENILMKKQLQEEIKSRDSFKFLYDEQKCQAEDEMMRCAEYKRLMLLTQQTFKSSLFTSANNQQMQGLIQQLTMSLTEKDDDLAIQKQLNRQLRESLDLITRERDLN